MRSIKILIICSLLSILLGGCGDKEREKQEDAKAALHNLFLACKAYWADTDPEVENCTVDLVRNDLYGYTDIEGIEVLISTGQESDFNAKSKILKCSKDCFYSINSAGVVDTSSSFQ